MLRKLTQSGYEHHCPDGNGEYRLAVILHHVFRKAHQAFRSVENLIYASIISPYVDADFVAGHEHEDQVIYEAHLLRESVLRHG